MTSVIGGRNAVVEILKNDRAAVEKVLLMKTASGEPIERAKEAARSRSIPIETTDPEVLDDRTGGSTHQGIAVVIQQLHPHTLDDLLRSASSENSRLLVLDQIQDPVNLGKLARTALFFGYDGIVKTKDRTAPLSQTVIETSVGAAARIPVAQVTNLRRALEKIRDERYWLVGLSLDAEKPVGSVDPDRKLAVVLGNEDHGLRRLTAEECDYLVSIPGQGDFDSLNVATAGAIAAYALNPERDPGDNDT